MCLARSAAGGPVPTRPADQACQEGAPAQPDTEQPLQQGLPNLEGEGHTRGQSKAEPASLAQSIAAYTCPIQQVKVQIRDKPLLEHWYLPL